jgi:hypothetical protein
VSTHTSAAASASHSAPPTAPHHTWPAGREGPSTSAAPSAAPAPTSTWSPYKEVPAPSPSDNPYQAAPSL